MLARQSCQLWVWEIPGDFGGGAGSGRDLGQGGTSVAYHALESTLQSSHFIQGNRLLLSRYQWQSQETSRFRLELGSPGLITYYLEIYSTAV